MSAKPQNVDCSAETTIKSPTHVYRRDGSLAPFAEERITSAIRRAGAATTEFDAKEAERLAKAVVRVLCCCHHSKGYPDIERIQNIVEQALISAGYLNTARAYIVYREQHALLRRERATAVNVEASVNEYLNRADWRVNANANQGYSLGGLILNVAGKVTANYWLDHVYPPEIGQAHRDAAIHIHDLDMLAGYCAGWSLRRLLNEGLNGIPGKVEAAPPKHLSSAVGQMVNFLGTLQNEWAGAQAFSSFDTYLAPYIRKDNLSYENVKQNIQEFIYNLNVPSRWGTQTPFTNVTFDWVCPEDISETHPEIAGEIMPFTYGQLQTEMDMINKAYLEVMAAGDAKGRVFTFPIPTYNITPDFVWEGENADLLFELTAKYGLPYFQNFLNSELKPNMIRSMCCRLQLDLRELLKRGNGLFGSAEQTGSIGVVTLNGARLGYLYPGDEAKLLEQTDHLLNLAKTSLEIKRKVISKHIKGGLFPYTKRYLGGVGNHFSTIGINGVNELIRNFTQNTNNIADAWGQAFAARYLDHIRSRLVSFQEETGNLYNLEATPAEGTTYRFAKEDQKRFPNILQAGTTEKPYYTNSTQLPVSYTNDPFEALELQDELQCKYTGGTVLHLYLGERMSSAAACKRLVRNVLSRYRLPYITVTPTFSVCPTHGYLAGEKEFCPHCDEARIIQKHASRCKERAIH